MTDSNSNQTHYEVIGVQPSASQADIKSAYQAAALRTHPDKAATGGGEGSEFQRLQTAWQVLRDPQQRARYDHVLTQQELRATVTLQEELPLDEMSSEVVNGIQSYIHACRCGDEYVLSPADLPPRGGAGTVVVPCRSCSNHIMVHCPES